MAEVILPTPVLVIALRLAKPPIPTTFREKEETLEELARKEVGIHPTPEVIQVVTAGAIVVEVMEEAINNQGLNPVYLSFP